MFEDRTQTQLTMQADAWQEVWRRCIELGMEIPPCGRGIDHVLNFITSLAERPAYV